LGLNFWWWALETITHRFYLQEFWSKQKKLYFTRTRKYGPFVFAIIFKKACCPIIFSLTVTLLLELQNRLRRFVLAKLTFHFIFKMSSFSVENEFSILFFSGKQTNKNSINIIKKLSFGSANTLLSF
jgi:hypothetical protein